MVTCYTYLVYFNFNDSHILAIVLFSVGTFSVLANETSSLFLYESHLRVPILTYPFLDTETVGTFGVFFTGTGTGNGQPCFTIMGFGFIGVRPMIVVISKDGFIFLYGEKYLSMNIRLNVGNAL